MLPHRERERSLRRWPTVGQGAADDTPDCRPRTTTTTARRMHNISSRDVLAAPGVLAFSKHNFRLPTGGRAGGATLSDAGILDWFLKRRRRRNSCTHTYTDTHTQTHELSRTIFLCDCRLVLDYGQAVASVIIDT
ncbi:hypothetical protein L7F22_048676 [Adiantum nelumboides]|nr:hypothetical protein [Adiantum nelumboides]